MTGIMATRSTTAHTHGNAEGETLARMYRTAVLSSASGIMISDSNAPDRPVIFINPAFSRITGYGPSEVLGRNARFLVRHDPEQPGIAQLRHSLRRGETTSTLLRFQRKDGQLFWADLNIAPVHDDAGRIGHFVSILTDVTDRVEQSEQLSYLATHDRLTSLANRSLLIDRLSQAISRSHRQALHAAVVIIDIDRFKLINDELGNGVGNTLLIEFGQRLRECVRQEDTVARLGDNEFAIVLDALHASDDPTRPTHAVLRSLTKPFTVGQAEYFLTASIGIAVHPHDGVSPDDLMRNARLAMQRIKRNGGNGFCCFSPDSDRRSHQLLVQENELHHALRRNEFVLYYQPKLDLFNGSVTGVEALLRWLHPERGLVPPGEFIPLAETLGLIHPMGEWVLNEACRQAREWMNAGLPPTKVAINVSAHQLRTAGLADAVASALIRHSLPPSWLELEITESAVMDDIASASTILKQISALGVSLALDDFGTGHASLSYLRRLPFNTLKIDRSFIQNVVTDPGDASLSLAIIAMARSLGLRTVAEGVETEAQRDYLRKHLCDEMQGFLISRPLPAAQAGQYLLDAAALTEAGDDDGGARPTLLLVDDEQDILNALHRVLRRSGYRILATTDPDEAFNLLARNIVHVLIVDQRMPRMSGVEFLQRARKLYPNTVRMVLSGYVDIESVTGAINRGEVFRHLTKPWDPEELREQVRLAFNRHGHQLSSSQLSS